MNKCTRQSKTVDFKWSNSTFSDRPYVVVTVKHCITEEDPSHGSSVVNDIHPSGQAAPDLGSWTPMALVTRAFGITPWVEMVVTVGSRWPESYKIHKRGP